MLALAVMCVVAGGSAVFLKDHDPHRDVIAERMENSGRSFAVENDKSLMRLRKY